MRIIWWNYFLLGNSFGGFFWGILLGNSFGEFFLGILLGNYFWEFFGGILCGNSFGELLQVILLWYSSEYYFREFCYSGFFWVILYLNSLGILWEFFWGIRSGNSFGKFFWNLFFWVILYSFGILSGFYGNSLRFFRDSMGIIWKFIWNRMGILC